MEQALTIHDMTDFPIVRFRLEAVTPGFSAAWVSEMELLCEGPAFALIFPRFDIGESHEDFKVRGLWLKENHDRLTHKCKLLVTVEEVPERRAELGTLVSKRGKAFGVKQACVGSISEAEALAQHELFAA